MQLAPATRLAHYEISELLGRGGMGEVWLATDTKLGRDVALKVLPDEFVGDSERRARFEREARLLASLRHPNIIPIYGIEQADGIHFLVMAVADGEDLAARLRRGPLPVREAIDVAVAIAEALEAAHEKGIIHRDLKPSNIRVTPEGRATVLDFGLGKALDGQAPASDLSNSPTLARAGTQSGVILGTAAYMSPEQARGRDVDRRVDVWAFGVVLWEMLTGRQLFGAETVSDTLASVLTMAIDLDAVPSETPPNVRWVLRNCLQRDPRQRLRDIGDARLVLTGAADLGLASVTGSGPKRRPFMIAAAIATLLIVAAAATVLFIRSRRPEAPLRKLDLEIGAMGVGFAPPMISPDGGSVVFPAERGLAIRQLDDVNQRLVAEAHDVTYASWSPDSQHIAFVSRGRLWRVGRDGKPAVAIAALPKHLAGAGGLAWLPDDRIVLAGSNVVGLLEVSSRGGRARDTVPLSKPSERDFHQVSALPDDRGLLFTVHRAGGVADRIDVFSNGRRQTVLTVGGDMNVAHPAYSPTGHIIFEKEGASELWAVPFSLADLRTTGEPFLIGNGSVPSIAADGTLAYLRGSRQTNRQLMRVDRAGRIEAEIGRPAPESLYADIAPDGRRVVATIAEGVAFDLAVFDTETRTMTRLTSGPGVEWQADWSPDGRQITFGVGTRDAFAVIDAAGGKFTVVGTGATPRWWPDGRSIVVTVIGEDGSLNVDRHVLETKLSVPLVASGANEHSPEPSRDGRFLAYVSDETGRDEVFVRELDGERRTIQVSSHGTVGAPRWSPKGDELFFRAADAMYGAKRAAGERLAFADPQRLFSFQETGIDRFDRSFDVTPDGKGFVVTRDTTDDATRGVLTIVTNWPAEFRKR